PVDVDAIRAAAAVDLERHRLAGVDADVGGEALDLQVARSVDVPFGRRIPRLAVFRDDPVRRPDAVWRRPGRTLRCATLPHRGTRRRGGESGEECAGHE